MASLDTVIQDIYQLVSGEKENHKIDEENLDNLFYGIKEVLIKYLEPSEKKENYLRVSKLGTPNRKLWFDLNSEPETLDPQMFMRFLYGSLLEEILLFLLKEAGHKVTGLQKEIDINGVKGHQDCEIDDVVVDIKSASATNFRKFKNGTLFSDDPYGYIAQLSSYVHESENPKEGAFLAINKDSGELALLKIDQIDMINPEDRVDEIKQFLDEPTPPEEKCYEPVNLGESGNKVLHKNCKFCPHKDVCWQDANGGFGLRKFQYSNEIKDFVHIEALPRVEEVTSPIST